MKTPQTNTTTTYHDFTRSTFSDIVCIVNSTKRQQSNEKSSSSSSKFRASMPYKKAIVLAPLQSVQSSDYPSSTVRVRESMENHVKLHEELKQERNRYFNKIISDKEEVARLQSESATKIQALFRGYRARPRYLRRVYKPMAKPKLMISKLHEELCIYASELNLKPIPGLNIETYRKTSKRRKKIENAAAFHICRFFMMISAKKLL